MLAYNRIAMSLIISEWRAEEHPENRDYILGNISHTWEVFEGIALEEMEIMGERLEGFAADNIKA